MRLSGEGSQQADEPETRQGAGEGEFSLPMTLPRFLEAVEHCASGWKSGIMKSSVLRYHFDTKIPRC